MSDGNNSTSSAASSLCEDVEVETNHQKSSKKKPLSRPVSSKPVNLVQCNHNNNQQIPLSPSPDFQSRPQSSQTSDEKLSVSPTAQEVEVEIVQHDTQPQFAFCSYVERLKSTILHKVLHRYVSYLIRSIFELPV